MLIIGFLIWMDLKWVDQAAQVFSQFILLTTKEAEKTAH